MISKAQIKFIQSLSQKKYRKQNCMFIAEGTKIAQELIGSNITINKIYATQHWLDKHRIFFNENLSRIVEVSEERELKQISFLTTPQEVVLLAEIPEEQEATLPIKDKMALGLESIRDPGNMGTIIRLADWYGLKEIFCSADCVDVYSPKVVQATMGSIARVRVHYTELKEVVRNAGMDVYAAVLGGDINVHGLKQLENAFLLIGNEGQGLSDELLSGSIRTVSIPSFGKAESLNAAIATGILLDNFRRVLGAGKF
jgi:TrmH family RNA methyltransferase